MPDVLDHLKLVHYVANKYSIIARKAGVDYDDVLQSGMEGLIIAAQKFDPSRGFQFSTYAVSWIQGTIRRSLYRNGPVKIPRPEKELSVQLLRMGLEESAPKEISEKLGCSERAAQRALESLKVSVISMDKPIYEDNEGNSVTVADRITGEPDFSNAHIQEFLNGLSDRDREIIGYRMQGLGQKEIGGLMGLSQVYVSRLLQRIGERYRRVG